MNANVKTKVKKDFISLMDYSQYELEQILRLTHEMKSGAFSDLPLAGKQIGLLFCHPSTRTRISFQVGAHQLGAHAEYYRAEDLQLKNRESIIDTATVFGKFLDGLIVRNYDSLRPHGQARHDLLALSKYSNLPVINALDDKEHPCQVMADIYTLIEKYGADYKKKKMVFTWGYSQYQQSFGIPQSMLIAASILGMNLTFAHPEGFDLDEEYTSFANAAMKLSGGTLEYSHDLKEACDGADVIYVKSYKAIHMSPEEYVRTSNRIRDEWCVSREHFGIANPGAYFMNCMPIVRGEQATEEVVDGKQSLIYQEAENRLHVQKAIMATTMGENR